MTKLFEPLIAEMQQEATATRRVLERAPAEKFNWRPHAKSMSLGELAYHIATVPRGVTNLLKQDVVDIATIMVPQRSPGSTAALLDDFDQAQREAAATLRSMSDQQALGNWTLARNGQAIMTLPRVAAVRMIVMNHIYHHRGQMTMYLRLLDVPVPSIYGPTADDNPFRDVPAAAAATGAAARS